MYKRIRMYKHTHMHQPNCMYKVLHVCLVECVNIYYI